MKKLNKLVVFSLALACFLLFSGLAKADTILTLDTPSQIGDTNLYTFTGTITNTDPSATVFLNGDFVFLDSPLTHDDIDFYNNAPLYLDPLASSGDIALFTVTVPDGTPLGLYAGTYEIVGGADNNAQDVIASENFNVQVTPEPSSLVLLATGLAGLAGTLRRRLTR